MGLIHEPSLKRVFFQIFFSSAEVSIIDFNIYLSKKFQFRTTEYSKINNIYQMQIKKFF